LISNHIKANQFFCPKAFDLSFYGLRDGVSSKMLNIKLQSSGSSNSLNYLSDKKFMILINEEEVVQNRTSGDLYSVKKAGLHWMNASLKQPTRTVFNFQRTMTIKEGPQFWEMLGFFNTPKNFTELPSNLIQTEAYFDMNDNTTISAVTFQLNRHLRILQHGDDPTDSICYAVALTGGFLFLGYAVLRVFFSIYVPWMMYSETVRLLFKLDPRKPRAKRSELRMSKKDPLELIKEA
jgi:hypothetical protein